MPGSVWTGFTAPQNNQTLLAIMQGLKELGQVAQQYKGDQQANQMMNTQNAPRAALVNPENGQTVPQFERANPQVPVGGTPPFRGGMQGMEMQMALNKQNQSSASQQLENTLKMYQMANLKSEMANRQRSGEWNYPSGTNRYTPTSKQQGAMNNPWGVNSNLLTSNGAIPESTAKEFQMLNENNAEFKSRYGVGIKEFTQYDSGWKQNPDGTWVNHNFAGNHGPMPPMTTEDLTNARVLAQRNMATYKTLRSMGWGPAMDKLTEIQGAINNGSFQQPDTSPQAPVAGQQGKQGVPNSPMTGGQYINNIVPTTGPNNAQTAVGQGSSQQPLPNPLYMQPGAGMTPGLP